MPKTWTFREDEGGTTTISYDVDENSVYHSTGPDCDGTRTERTIYFIPATPRSPFHSLDVWYRRDNSRTEFNVFTENPDNAAADRAIHELGWALFTDKELLSQPDPR